MVMMKWWLIPSWSKDGKASYATFNARCEDVATKPAFRGPFKSKRCLIPADGFYEWKKTGEGKAAPKIPHFIRTSDGKPFALAGLWNCWHGGEGDEARTITSCTIVTTTPNEVMEQLHNRMPVILPREAYAMWLDPAVKDREALESLLVPYAGAMEAYPVSTAVNKPGPNGPELIARGG